MKELGFGVINQRSIIVFFVVMVLTQLLTGFQIPIDMQNPQNLFTDIILLTGYVYVATTIYKLPFALITSIFTTLIEMIYIIMDGRDVSDIISGFGSLYKDINKQQSPALEWELESEGGGRIHDKLYYVELIFIILSFVLRGIVVIILAPIFFIFNALILTVTFGTWAEKKMSQGGSKINEFFKIIDRLGIVIIAVIVTMPVIKVYLTLIGIGGLLLIVLTFVLRGNFSAIVQDDQEKETTKTKENIHSSPNIHVENFRSSPIYVEVVNRDEIPIKIDTSKHFPLYTENVNNYNNPVPVAIDKINVFPPSHLPVTVINEGSFPLQVEVSNYSVPVEVTNTVTVQKDED